MNYWEERYQKQDTGWDIGTISTPLKEYIDQLTDKKCRILLPGAGNGYEFDYLIHKGFTNVFVVGSVNCWFSIMFPPQASTADVIA